MRDPQVNSAAIVTIKKPNEMTRAGRKRVASWLRKQAADFERYGSEYASRFTARYLYGK